MDTDLRHKSEVSDLDFIDKQDVSQVNTPDQMPPIQKYRDIPKDILKTTTVENLISQNDDLMARLRVALRRLSILELENQRLSESSAQARMSASASHDQLLIMKEKDNLWKQKTIEAEQERDLLRKNMEQLSFELRSKQSDINRFQKYHDRIKNNVKPYLTQLKEYSRNLEDQNAKLISEKDHLEALLRDLRYQVIEVTKNSQYQIEQQDIRIQEMIETYENTIKDLQSELTIIRESHSDLEARALRLNKSLERQDELENKLIETERSKEEQKQNFEKEFDRLSNKVIELQKDHTRFSIENKDLSQKVLEDYEKIKILERRDLDMTQQLEGLRFMWNAKNDEAEKLKVTLNALEKLNIELSNKINEMRESKA